MTVFFIFSYCWISLVLPDSYIRSTYFKSLPTGVKSVLNAGTIWTCPSQTIPSMLWLALQAFSKYLELNCCWDIILNHLENTFVVFELTLILGSGVVAVFENFPTLFLFFDLSCFHPAEKDSYYDQDCALLISLQSVWGTTPLFSIIRASVPTFFCNLASFGIWLEPAVCKFVRWLFLDSTAHETLNYVYLCLLSILQSCENIEKKKKKKKKFRCLPIFSKQSKTNLLVPFVDVPHLSFSQWS